MLMKKTILILLLFLLCACTSTNPDPSVEENTVVEEAAASQIRMEDLQGGTLVAATSSWAGCLRQALQRRYHQALRGRGLPHRCHEAHEDG